MTRVPASYPTLESAEAQIDDAVLRLVDLFAVQAARELATDAHLMETPDGTEPPEED